MTPEKLKNRKIRVIDIALDKSSENKLNYDPTTFRSQKASRGPLYPGWTKTETPIMCCYKLATIDCKAGLFKGTMESIVEKVDYIKN